MYTSHLREYWDRRKKTIRDKDVPPETPPELRPLPFILIPGLHGDLLQPRTVWPSYFLRHRGNHWISFHSAPRACHVQAVCEHPIKANVVDQTPQPRDTDKVEV